MHWGTSWPFHHVRSGWEEKPPWLPVLASGTVGHAFPWLISPLACSNLWLHFEQTEPWHLIPFAVLQPQMSCSRGRTGSRGTGQVPGVCKDERPSGGSDSSLTRLSYTFLFQNNLCSFRILTKSFWCWLNKEGSRSFQCQLRHFETEYDFIVKHNSSIKPAGSASEYPRWFLALSFSCLSGLVVRAEV